nr:hypothetical protein [Escherichia coli]
MGQHFCAIAIWEMLSISLLGSGSNESIAGGSRIILRGQLQPMMPIEL